MKQERLYNIILGAHISEKASLIADKANQFAFKVSKDAIEKIYEVPVKKGAVMNVKGKVKRNARGFSKRAGWKKAYVSLEAGHDIDFS
jgi:large subunit ribosomal protein L23